MEAEVHIASPYIHLEAAHSGDRHTCIRLSSAALIPVPYMWRSQGASSSDVDVVDTCLIHVGEKDNVNYTSFMPAPTQSISRNPNPDYPKAGVKEWQERLGPTCLYTCIP